MAVGRDGLGEVLRATTSESREGEDACWSEYLALEATRGTLGEKDGGGLTGGAPPGDVMDTGGGRVGEKW